PDGRQEPTEPLGPLGILTAVVVQVHRLAGLQPRLDVVEPADQDRGVADRLARGPKLLGGLHCRRSPASSPSRMRGPSRARRWRIPTVLSLIPRTGAASELLSPSRYRSTSTSRSDGLRHPSAVRTRSRSSSRIRRRLGLVALAISRWAR